MSTPFDTAPPPLPGAPTPPPHSPALDGTLDALRRQPWRRSHRGLVGGVCAGIAERTGLHPGAVRAGAVVLALLFGVGITCYMLAWALIPDRRDRIHLGGALREGRPGSIAVVVLAALSLFSTSPWWWH